MGCPGQKKKRCLRQAICQFKSVKTGSLEPLLCQKNCMPLWRGCDLEVKIKKNYMLGPVFNARTAFRGPKIISTEFWGRRCSDFRTIENSRFLAISWENLLGHVGIYTSGRKMMEPQFFLGCGEHRRSTFLFLTSY